MYGSKPLEFVQGPGEAVYLPHGLAHSVLNLRDNVAVTENFLFVDALPELMSKVVLDEISAFRPGWDEHGLRKLYYGGLVDAEDRDAMRAQYEHAVKRVSDQPAFCAEAERARKDKLRSIFGNRKPEYVRYSSLPSNVSSITSAESAARAAASLPTGTSSRAY